jgi:hypothetical protein
MNDERIDPEIVCGPYQPAPGWLDLAAAAAASASNTKPGGRSLSEVWNYLDERAKQTWREVAKASVQAALSHGAEVFCFTCGSAKGDLHTDTAHEPNWVSERTVMEDGGGSRVEVVHHADDEGEGGDEHDSTRCKGCYVISEGTLRTDELLTAWLAELERHAPNSAMLYRLERDELIATWNRNASVEDQAKHTWYDHPGDDSAALLLESVRENLQEMAPAGHHFGTTDGDGALYGFWWSGEDA